jgi:hypothetical protein
MEMVIHIKELNVLRIIFLGKEMIVRGYRDIFCENTWSDITDLRPREFLTNNIRSAGESVGIRRYPI